MNEQVLLTRKRLEAKIEELIELLDMIDGDPDLEDNGDRELDLSDYEEIEWSNPCGLRVHVPEELKQLIREQGYHS